MVPIMNSRQCHRRPQSHGLPMNSQYAANPGASVQAAYPLAPSFHGLPGSDAELNFMVTPSEAANILSSNYSLATSMSLPQSSTDWAGATQSTTFDDQNPNNVYGYSGNTISNDNSRAFLGGLNFGGVPRSWPLPYDPEMLGDSNMPLDGYNSSIYMMDPERYAAQNLSGAGSALDSTTQPSHREFARLSISPPKMEHDTMSPDDTTFDKQGTFRMPSSESSEESGSSREATAMEIEDHATSDEPYAKLIYRALMSAPNHSMVLQEIYQWFRDNTIKGSSDTKGWMNSIRHNLSMNAAFKKTERKMSGDETKKSTEWVLEGFAIKDGVQSTTRYRKGTGAKKFSKSDNPAPSRQSSGRKGGMSASKSKLQRQRGKEERPDLRHVMQRIDSGRRLEFQQHTSSRITQRQRSPSTPPHSDNLASSSPYFMPKQEPFEMPFEDMYRLEEVQGVYIDDGAIFSNHQNSHNPGPYLINSSHRY